MADQTNVSTPDLAKSGTEILGHHEGLQAVLDKWHSTTEEFHNHSGDDGVDGQLKSQAQTALEDGKRGGDVAARRSGKAGESANEAASMYSGQDQDGGANIATVNNAIPK